MLSDLGHTVHEAEGGPEALAKLAGGLKVDAIISDYMMPRMNGAELARRLGELYPDLPILIITGYAGSGLELRQPQLAKPFRQADLAAALDALVNPGNVVRLRPSGR